MAAKPQPIRRSRRLGVPGPPTSSNRVDSGFRRNDGGGGSQGCSGSTTTRPGGIAANRTKWPRLKVRRWEMPYAWHTATRRASRPRAGDRLRSPGGRARSCRPGGPLVVEPFAGERFGRQGHSAMAHGTQQAARPFVSRCDRGSAQETGWAVLPSPSRFADRPSGAFPGLPCPPTAWIPAFAGMTAGSLETALSEGREAPADSQIGPAPAVPFSAVVGWRASELSRACSAERRMLLNADPLGGRHL